MRLNFPVAIFSLLMPILSSIDAAGIAGSSIVVHSPFLPPDFNPPGSTGSQPDTSTTLNQYQFKGVYQLGGEYFFHLYDERSRQGSWMSRDSITEGYPRIIQFKEMEDLLVVEKDGEQFQLNMIRGSSKPVPLTSSRPSMRSVQMPGQSGPTVISEPVIRRGVIRPEEETTAGTSTRRLTFPSRPPNS
jgi:hypothetical protein